ncbi:MAG: aldo/keto reductase [Acidimicrobiales bacterium]
MSGPASVAALGTARLGRHGPTVTRLGLGCAPLGNLFTAVGDDEATAAVDAAWDAGIRYFDTAPLYGHGLSERRLGRALARRPRDEWVLSTKVGRLLRPVDEPVDTIFDLARSAGGGGGAAAADPAGLAPTFDFSADGVLRSIEESLVRLGTDRLDVVLVHDPDDHQDEALAGAFPALVRLRDEGVVGAVGAGMNQWPALDRFVQQVDLDVVLLAGRATLLDRSGTEVLLPRCAERGVGVVLGGVFNSGVLAAPPGTTATYDYGEVPAEVAGRVARLASVCEAAGVALPAAALRWALRRDDVAAVVVGARSPAEVAADVAWATAAVPDHLWDELEAVR